MKGQCAASAVAIASLAREGFEPNGDLIFLAAADEEVGDGYGLMWLVEQRPDLVGADYVVNEGGGERLVHEGTPIYTVSVGEKMSAPFAITTRGRSGHASTPSVADNALVKMTPVIERLEAMERPSRELAELALFARAVAGRPVDPYALFERARSTNPVLAALIEPMLAASLAPTEISASPKRNVIPSRCRLVCDSRILPGMTTADMEAAIRRALAGLEYELEFLEAEGGTISAPDDVLFPAIERFVGTIEPGARAAPMVLAGFTDSHWMREAFGSVAYGFMPMQMDPIVAGSVIHSTDERARTDDLELAARFFVEVAREIGGRT
jgi:acetylornithine deacetylase/succinyl-diaminopimelate desuccinylase-like protein